MSGFAQLPAVLARLEKTVVAFERDAAPLAAHAIREHIARDFANSVNAAGESLLPYGAAWGMTKRELGLRLNRGQAGGGILSALRAAKSVARVARDTAVINPELANATSPYPKSLGGAKSVNRYMGHYSRRKANSNLMAVSGDAATAAEKVLNLHLDELLKKV